MTFEMPRHLVPARLAQVYDFDALREVMHAGLVHAFKGHPNEAQLRRYVREQHGVKDPRKFFLVPIKTPESQVENAKDWIDLHKRAVFRQVNGGVVQLKGFGNVCHRKKDQDMTLTTRIRGKRVTVSVPFGKALWHGSCFGAFHQFEANDTLDKYERLCRGYRLFLKREPKLARSLGCFKEPPFAKPVALFAPIEILGTDKESELIRVPIQHLRAEEPAFSEARLLIVKGDSPLRLLELEHCSPDVYNNRLKELAAHFSLGANVNTFEGKKAIYSAVMKRAVAIMYSARKYAGLAMHSENNVLLAVKDFTGTMLYDTNNIDKATSRNFYDDELALDTLSQHLRNVLKFRRNEEIYLQEHLQNLAEIVRLIEKLNIAE